MYDEDKIGKYKSTKVVVCEGGTLQMLDLVHDELRDRYLDLRDVLLFNIVCILRPYFCDAHLLRQE